MSTAAIEGAAHLARIVIEQGQKINALEAQVAKLEADYAAEVAEMNAGYSAYKQGQRIDEEPSNTRFDVWRIGWVWAKWNAEEELQ